jgi:hypothetical protein
LFCLESLLSIAVIQVRILYSNEPFMAQGYSLVAFSVRKIVMFFISLDY